MAKNKKRLLNPIHPINLALQKVHVQRRFPDFSARLRNGHVIWRGSLQPRDISPIYLVEIFYKWNKIPKVNVISPSVPEDAPHRYHDGRLCLYWPKEWSWRQDKIIAEYVIPWTASWLYYYELWLDTGKWLGPSSHENV